MELASNNNTAHENGLGLMIVDMQKHYLDHFDEGSYANLTDNCIKVIKISRAASLPIYVIRFDIKSFKPQLDTLISMNLEGYDKLRIIGKKHNDAFLDTQLSTILKNDKVRDVLVVGIYTASCVSQTCDGASLNGFNPIVVKDAIWDTPNRHGSFLGYLGIKYRIEDSHSLKELLD